MDHITNHCPSIRELEVWRIDKNTLSSFQWLSWIPRLKNLQKIVIQTYVPVEPRWPVDEYNIFLGVINLFVENPLVKLKEIKMSEVGAFFQDDFLCQLNKAFPNLESYNVDYGKLIEKLPYPQRFWCLRSLTSVLDSLGSVKNLNFPSMDLALIGKSSC